SVSEPRLWPGEPLPAANASRLLIVRDPETVWPSRRTSDNGSLPSFSQMPTSLVRLGLEPEPGPRVPWNATADELTSMPVKALNVAPSAPAASVPLWARTVRGPEIGPD